MPITQHAGMFIGTTEEVERRLKPAKLLHILDHQTDEIVTTIETFWADEHLLELNTNEHFDFTTLYEYREYLSGRYRVVIPSEGAGYHELLIDETVKIDDTMEVYCSASFIDIKKQKVIDPVSLQDTTASIATDNATSGTEWLRGIIESDGIRDMEIDTYTNPFSMLKRIASTFELELRFRVEIRGNRIVGRYVDMIQKQGAWQGKEVELGKDLVGVKRREVSDNIVTALKVIGPEKEDGTQLTVEVTDEDARQRWSRTGAHLWDKHEPQTENEDITLERLETIGRTELNKRINAVVEYEADTVSLEYIFGLEHEKVRLGDMVRIKDTSYTPALYMEARVISIKRSLTDPTQKTYVLGDFIEYEEADIMAIARALTKKIEARQRSKYARSDMIKLQSDAAYNLYVNDEETHNEIASNMDLSTFKKQALDTAFTDYQTAYNDYKTDADAIVNNEEATKDEQIAVTQKYMTAIEKRRKFTQEVERSIDDYTQGKTDALETNIANGLVPITLDGQNNIIQTADSTFYIDGQGNLIFVDPNDPNYIMKLTSEGLGISTTGMTGNFQTVMTAEGLNVAAVVTGVMSADFIRGGALDVGGAVDGILRVLDSEGIPYAEFTKEGSSIGSLYVEELSGGNVITTNTENIDYYVDEAGSDDNDGKSVSYPFRSVSKVWDVLPKYNEGNIVIRVKSRLVESITVPTFLGNGKITIDFQSQALIGRVYVPENSNIIEIQNGTINQPSSAPGESIEIHGARTKVKDMVIYTNNLGMWSVVAHSASRVEMENVEVHGATRAGIGVRNMSQATVTNCSGYAPDFGVDVYRAIAFAIGTCPNGGTSNVNTFQGGQLFGTFSNGSGTDEPAQTPTEKTETFSATDAGAWRPNFGGQWHENQPMQGQYSSYGPYKGLWLFGSSLTNTVSGKTISRARIRIKRSAKGGQSAAVGIVLRHHGYTSKPAGEPTLASDTKTVNLSWGDREWVELPSSFRTALSNGTAKGIGVYSGSNAYGYLDASAEIEVTYT